jgi:hypothetical protein
MSLYHYSVRVHPHAINLCYTRLPGTGTLYPRSFDNLKDNTPRKHNTLSHATKSKIKKAIEYLLFISQSKKAYDLHNHKKFTFKISFCTLTLASQQMHSDKFLNHNLLNHFFVEAKKKWQVKNYFWRSEKQKNGNIHWHILFDKFIPWSELRDCWNRIQNKYHYVDAYRNQMKRFHGAGFKIRQDLLKSWSHKDQLRAYKFGSKSDWQSPNSSDIHSLRFINNISSYIIKYVSKESQLPDNDSRTWGCSSSLSNLTGAILDLDSYIDDEINSIKSSYSITKYESDFYTVFYVKIQQFFNIQNSIIVAAFAAYIFDKFGYYFSRPMF